jgi:hypothetical protein
MGSLISVCTNLSISTPLTRQCALPRLSREAAASERASSELLAEPANQSPTSHDSPATLSILYPDTVIRAIAYRRRHNGRSYQGAQR